MNRPALTQREIALFFFPLFLNVQFMSVSHSIINAALARVDDFVTALAAFSVAMVVHLLFASPSYQNHTITIAMVRGRQSLRGMVIFVLLVATYVSAMLCMVAFTPMGDFVLLQIMGVETDVAAGARSVIALLAFLPFFTGFRGLFQGLVIRARRTGLVSFATAVRIGALLLFLLIGKPWFSGPELGAFALLSCIIVETALMGFFAWRHHLPATGEEEHTTSDILRFGFPLAYSSCLQQTIPVLIAAMIARLPDGELALASFGVIRALLFLLSGPMRNLQQAYLTLVKDHRDYRQLVSFFIKVSLGMGLITLALAYPLNHLMFGRIMGIETDMRHYLALPLAACAVYPLLYGASNLLRGYFAGSKQTRLLGRSTIYKVLYLLTCWALVLLLQPSVSGIALAIFLLISTEILEAAYLRSKRPSAFTTSACAL